MLSLNHISLFQFRNYRSGTFSFSERVIGLHGLNGGGKTNLLDAVHYCCFSRSYFTRNDALLVTHGCQGFRLEAGFGMNGHAQAIEIVLRENGKKEIREEGVLIPRVSRYIGRYPAVMICPDDTELIIGGSEERRRFMDVLFSQVDEQYLDALIQYNRILQQRNTYLKMAAQENRRDEMLLDTYDRMLLDSGSVIFEKRKIYLQKLTGLIRDHYGRISGPDEPVQAEYESKLKNASFADLLTASKEKDYAAQRTLQGPHKDDILFFLFEQPFKTVASQGQRKSLLFSLKMAEYDLLQEHKGFAPILLLDDVFEKLDARRMHHLLNRVCRESEGQVFLTDTHEERIAAHFREIGVAIELKEIK